MGWMQHTEVKESGDKAVLDVVVTPVDQLKVAGTVNGGGSMVAVANYGSNNLITFRFRLKVVIVQAVE